MADLDRRVFVQVARCRERLTEPLQKLLKERDLSVSQYQALETLRQAGDKGMPTQSIARHLVRRVPDMTRLIDRLEERSLVQRERSPQDRRVVLIRIRPRGLEILRQLDGPVEDVYQTQVQRLELQEKQTLLDLLTRLGYRHSAPDDSFAIRPSTSRKPS